MYVLAKAIKIIRSIRDDDEQLNIKVKKKVFISESYMRIKREKRLP